MSPEHFFPHFTEAYILIYILTSGKELIFNVLVKTLTTTLAWRFQNIFPSIIHPA